MQRLPAVVDSISMLCIRIAAVIGSVLMRPTTDWQVASQASAVAASGPPRTPGWFTVQFRSVYMTDPQNSRIAYEPLLSSGPNPDLNACVGTNTGHLGDHAYVLGFAQAAMALSSRAIQPYRIEGPVRSLEDFDDDGEVGAYRQLHTRGQWQTLLWSEYSPLFPGDRRDESGWVEPD